MRKLSLEDLEVESFAVQPSESELASVKGGSGWACAARALGGLIMTSSTVVDLVSLYNWLTDDSNDVPKGTTTAISGYGAGASITIKAPDGTEYTITANDSVFYNASTYY